MCQVASAMKKTKQAEGDAASSVAEHSGMTSQLRWILSRDLKEVGE